MATSRTKTISRRRAFSLLLSLPIYLSACGGGGGSGSASPAPSPAPGPSPAPSPSPSGYGPRVTPGIEPGVTLQNASANWSTSANDQLVEGLTFHSPPTIRHARVRFKNCKWLTAVGQTYPGGNHWAFDPAITDDPAMAGLIFEHNDFADALPAFGSPDPAQPMFVRACIMRGTSDGYGDSAKAGSNVVIEDSSFVYAHSFLSFAHSDGLQSDVGDVVHVIVRYSYFDIRGTGSNAALLQNEVSAHHGDWLIEHNRIQVNSAYAIRARNLTGDGRVVIRNNAIDRTWIYGPLDVTTHPELIDWIDNVDEHGQPITQW